MSKISACQGWETSVKCQDGKMPIQNLYIGMLPLSTTPYVVMHLKNIMQLKIWDALKEKR